MLVIANSDFVNSSKSLFWPEVINLAEIDLDIVGIGGSTANRNESGNDCFCRHQRSFAQQSSPEQTKRASEAEPAVWPAINDVPESIGKMKGVLKEGGVQNITLKPVFVLSPGYAHLPDGLNFV